MGNYKFLRFLRFDRRCNIKHSWPHCVPSFYWCKISFIGSLCFLQLLSCLHHYLLQLLLLPIYSSFVPWFFLLENLFFFCDSSPCTKININDIHICSDCLDISYGFPFRVWCILPLKHFLHLCKLRIVCHLMSIQTIDAASIWTILLTFLRLISSFCYYYNGLLLLLDFTHLHIVVVSPIVCTMFISLSWFCLWFYHVVDLDICGIESAFWASIGVIPFSHNRTSSLCICNVVCFILVVTILK